MQQLWAPMPLLTRAPSLTCCCVVGMAMCMGCWQLRMRMLPPLSLLSQHVAVVSGQQVPLEPRLLDARLAFLLDHRVADRVLLPGAAMLEAAVADAHCLLVSPLIRSCWPWQQ